jgi:hypothetical protein
MNSPKMMVKWGVLCALIATSALAAVPASRTQVTPGIINYQGRLLTPAGSAYMDGVYNIEFRLYASATGSGSGLWARVYPVYVKDGYFNVMLGGPGSSYAAVLPAYREENELWKSLWYDSADSSQSNNRYLGLKVTGVPAGAPAVPAEEAFPRQRLLSSPFAERAQMAQYAMAAYDTFTVGTTLMANGLITAAGGLTAGNLTTLTNTTVNGALTLNKGLTVNNEEALLNKGLTVTGATAYVKSGLDVAGVATFRGGLNAVNSKVQEEGAALIPSGVIVMWHGATPPTGWALCDGTKGTPNLKGRFIVGYDGGGYGIGATGGEAFHTLTADEMPSHQHTYWDVRESDDWSGSGDSEPSGDGVQRRDTTRASAFTGGSKAHENRPPFYALAYIMKL